MVIPLRDDNPTTRFPVLTVLLIAANLFVFAFVQPHGSTAEENAFDYQHAAVPCELVHGRPVTFAEIRTDTCGSTGALGVVGDSEPFPHKNVYLAVLVSMFLHASWLHVLGNMLFLWVFGNNVEDRFGIFGYAAFYVFAGLVAAVAHTLANSGSTGPFLGASGAIAGVMGAYFVLWPRARVLTWIALLLFVVLYLPAWLVLGVWLVFQFFTDPNTGVAWVAHVGGFAAGVVVAFVVSSVAGPPRSRPLPPAGWQ